MAGGNAKVVRDMEQAAILLRPPAKAEGRFRPIDILKAGYAVVKCFGTPSKGGPVFVRVAASVAGHPQGGFEAAAAGANNIALTTDGGIYFNGPPDANGRAELAFNV
jgi:hypothetical protein